MEYAKLEITVTCMAAPLQMDIVCNDVEWTYRARHGWWSLTRGEEIVHRGMCNADQELSIEYAFAMIGGYIAKKAAFERESAEWDEAQ